MRTILVFAFAVSGMNAAQVPGSLWMQVAAAPPGTSGSGAAQPMVLTPGITVPAGGTGITPLARPQAAPSPQPAGVPSGMSKHSPLASPVPAAKAPNTPQAAARAGLENSAIEGAVARPRGCTATLSASRVTVPARGQIVEITTVNAPEGCRPATAVRSGWIQPLSADQPGSVRFSVAANGSKDERMTTVQVADKVVVVEQAGVEAPPVSVVPGKLTFGLQRQKTPDARRIAVQSDNQSAPVLVTSSAEWVTASPVDGKSREYAVRIDPAKIPAGRLVEAAIRVTAGDAAVDVPVVVERVQTR